MWPNSQFSADLVIFTQEILNGKIHFLGSDTFTKLNWLAIVVLCIISGLKSGNKISVTLNILIPCL